MKLFPAGLRALSTAQQFLGLYSNPSSLEVSRPPSSGNCILNIKLTPWYQEQDITSLFVELEIEHPKLPDDELLLTVVTEVASMPTAYIYEKEILACDDDGLLEVTCEVARSPMFQKKLCRTHRSTVGRVYVSYIAHPREVTPATHAGPALDIRMTHGGISGSGYSLFAVPPSFDEPYDVTVRWNLTGSPAGTRAVWTWGEHPASITQAMNPMSVLQTYFSVGNLHSVTSEGDRPYGMYWFGNPPFNATQIAYEVQNMFANMSEFFEDGNESYRIFLRHNIHVGSRTGTAMDRSFMFGYDDFDDFTDLLIIQGVTQVLAHEMVHNWVLLENSLEAEGDDNWYPEGMAEYYSAFLSHKFGLVTKEDLVEIVNDKLAMYYTNPLVNLSNSEVQKITWNFTEAQRLPYGRGFAYAIATDAMIRERSEGKHTLGTVSLGLIRRAKSKRHYGLEEYMSLLAEELGPKATHDAYKAMTAGELVIPKRVHILGDGTVVNLVRKDAEVFQVGFNDRKALSGDHVIEDLIPGSRAEKAGLKNGDRLLNSLKLDDYKRKPDKLLTLIVERDIDGVMEELKISYRPRGWDMMECYQLDFEH